MERAEASRASKSEWSKRCHTIVSLINIPRAIKRVFFARKTPALTTIPPVFIWQFGYLFDLSLRSRPNKAAKLPNINKGKIKSVSAEKKGENSIYIYEVLTIYAVR